MKFDDIIEFAMYITDNDKISLDGLEIIYHLDTKTHRKLDEELFKKVNSLNDVNFNHGDEIEVNVKGIKFKFVKIDEGK